MVRQHDGGGVRRQQVAPKLVVQLEQLAARFNRKAGMRETWLSENQRLVSQDNFGFDLAAVEAAAKKHHKIYSMTATALVQLQPGPGQALKLQDWAWAKSCFKVLRESFKIFRYARELRLLYRWKLFTRRSIHERLKNKFEKKCLLARMSFVEPILEIMAAAREARQVELLDLTGKRAPLIDAPPRSPSRWRIQWYNCSYLCSMPCLSCFNF